MTHQRIISWRVYGRLLTRVNHVYPEDPNIESVLAALIDERVIRYWT